MGPRMVFRYSSTHEKALPNRSYRRRMELHPASHMPAPKGQGRPRVHHLREILNAVFFYILKSGCQWRLLPNDFPGGPPSTTPLGDGVSTAPGRGSTVPSLNASGFG